MEEQADEALAVHLGPVEPPEVADAIRRAGGRLVPLDEAEVLVWWGGRPREFPQPLPAGIRWVQLPSAGVEGWFRSGVPDRDRVWTSAAGAYATAVAEHALALLIAGVRALPMLLSQKQWDKSLGDSVGTLHGSTVTVVGAGGIGRALIPQLAVLGAEVVAVNRSGRPVPEAGRTLPANRLDEVWEQTDHVVVAAPATAQTRHLIGARELERLKPTSWVVNIARGSLIDTGALVKALAGGTIGGAGLDVTDPEPLPDNHPLWSEPRAIITPHVANPRHLQYPALASFVADNIARWIAGKDLNGIIDLDAGY